MALSDLAKQAQKFTIDNSPFILTAIGTAGVITTAVLTAKATFKAAELIAAEEYVRVHGMQNAEPFTNKEKAQIVWRLYLPAVGSAVLTCGAIVGANQIGTRRSAAMAAAFSVSEKAFSEYREKVQEKFGEAKAKQVVDEVQQDRVNRDFNDGEREVIILGGGDQLCYDSWSGRFFKSDMETLKKAMNDLNHRIINDNYASLTDFYNLLGLDQIAESDEIGWNVDKLLDIHFTTTLTPDGKPAISMEYQVTPIRDYFRLH